jgi:hypothetical protein
MNEPPEPSNGNEDMPALVRLDPYGYLSDSPLQHLIGVEAGVFSQYRWRLALPVNGASVLALPKRTTLRVAL